MRVLHNQRVYDARARDRVGPRRRVRSATTTSSSGTGARGPWPWRGCRRTTDRPCSCAASKRWAPPSGCASDDDCSLAQHCVKREYQATGICGLNTYHRDVVEVAPRTPVRSAGSNCSFDSDCPIHFMCAKEGASFDGLRGELPSRLTVIGSRVLCARRRRFALPARARRPSMLWHPLGKERYAPSVATAVEIGPSDGALLEASGAVHDRRMPKRAGTTSSIANRRPRPRDARCRAPRSDARARRERRKRDEPR